MLLRLKPEYLLQVSESNPKAMLINVNYFIFKYNIASSDILKNI